MLTAPAATIATWVEVCSASRPSSGAQTPNAAKATMEFIDSTVARLPALASRCSSAACIGPPEPCRGR